MRPPRSSKPSRVIPSGPCGGKYAWLYSATAGRQWRGRSNLPAPCPPPCCAKSSTDRACPPTSNRICARNWIAAVERPKHLGDLAPLAVEDFWFVEFVGKALNRRAWQER